MKRILLFMAIFLWPIAGIAQSNLDWIWSPEISYSKDVSERTTLSTKLSIFTVPDDISNDAFLFYIEPQFLGTFAVNSRLKLAGGYYFRWSEPLLDGINREHRLLQQLGYTSFLSDKRFSHRFRVEQRIRTSSYQNRIRYRLSTNLPIAGNDQDTSNKYFILKNEIMTAFNGSAADAENRATVGIGWNLKNDSEFELTLEYRTADIASDGELGYMLLLGTSFGISR